MQMYDYNVDEDENVFVVLDAEDSNIHLIKLESELEARALVDHLNGSYRGGYQYEQNSEGTYDLLDYDGTPILSYPDEETIKGLLTHLNR